MTENKGLPRAPQLHFHFHHRMMEFFFQWIAVREGPFPPEAQHLRGIEALVAHAAERTIGRAPPLEA